MKLVSFQIKECFGFRDSDQIELQDKTNLIYVLGRNSSGKASLLTALAHFAPHLKPESCPNFANFDASYLEPYLLAEYRVVENDFTLDTFIEALSSEMNRLNQGIPVISASNEYKRYKEEIIKKVPMLYAALFEKSTTKGHLWVIRNAAGDYLFSAEKDYKDRDERKKQISTLLIDLPRQLSLQINANRQLNINGSWQLFNPISADRIENLLVKQLPANS